MKGSDEQLTERIVQLYFDDGLLIHKFKAMASMCIETSFLGYCAKGDKMKSVEEV